MDNFPGEPYEIVELILGNAFETPVLDTLNGTKYRLLRIAHRDKTQDAT